MAEWSNAADSKSVIGIISIGGSNPPLSASILFLVFFVCGEGEKPRRGSVSLGERRLEAVPSLATGRGLAPSNPPFPPEFFNIAF